MSIRPEGPHDPEVYVVIGPSAIARDDRGEILETVEWHEDGRPDWTNAGICDHRGGGGDLGYYQLGQTIAAAEANFFNVFGEKPTPVTDEATSDSSRGLAGP